MDSTRTQRSRTINRARYNSSYSSNWNGYYRNNWNGPGRGYYKYRGKHGYSKRGHYKPKRQERPRSPSPQLGSEEYMIKKVQKTSALIMRQLLSPEDNIVSKSKPEDKSTKQKYNEKFASDASKQHKKKKPQEPITKKNVSATDMHDKIMNHLSNLNDAKKKNLITSSTAGYDTAFQHLVKQKRLEILQVLREMCSNGEKSENNSLINSVIPDIGIKIEDLPPEMITQLRDCFDVEIDFLNTVADIEKDFLNDPYILDNLSEKNENQNAPNQQNFVVVEDDNDNDNYVQNSTPDSDNTTGLVDEVDHPGDKSVEFINNAALFEETRIKSEPTEVDLTSVEEIIDDKIEIEDMPLIKLEPKETGNILNLNPVEEQTIKQKNTVSPIELDSEPEEIDKEVNTVSETDSASFQLDPDDQLFFLETVMRLRFSQLSYNVDQVMDRMMEIDRFVINLTKYRQDLFDKFLELSNFAKNNKRKRDDDNDNERVKCKPSIKCMTANEGEVYDLTLPTVFSPKEILKFGDIKEKILVMEIFEDKLAAGTENGKIYFFNLNNGSVLKALDICQSPITSLLFNEESEPHHMFIGTFHSNLKIYDYSTCFPVKRMEMEDSVQCLEQNWGYIFMGCSRGYLYRYSIRRGEMEYEDKLSDESILTLKATTEGARRVLLIGSKESSVCIRDAITGLHLRTIESSTPLTVNSLIFFKNEVYCATNNNILVFSFHEGKLLTTLKADTSKVIHSIQFLGKLLFGSCSNGHIYVYDIISRKFVGYLSGPGGNIISMQVLGNQILVSTSLKLTSLPIPEYILKQR